LILLISASWVARLTGKNHQCTAGMALLRIWLLNTQQTLLLWVSQGSPSQRRHIQSCCLAAVASEWWDLPTLPFPSNTGKGLL
jgi:hypothetical protein